MLEPRSDTEIAERLLVYLRGISGRPKLDYARSPRAITGGFDTRIFGPIVVRRYTEAYERTRTVDRERLSYYEALRCLMELSRVAERRLTRAGLQRNPWSAPREANRLISHFRRIAGVSPELPPMR